MSLLNTLKDKTKIAEFISKLFILSTQAHIFHLQVKGKGSYAIHMALNELYTTLPDFIDTLVESYQGKYGIITGYKLTDLVDFTDKIQVINYITDIHNSIEQDRTSLFKDSDSLNIIDEIKTLLKGTLYKLNNLE